MNLTKEEKTVRNILINVASKKRKHSVNHVANFVN